MAVSVRQPFHIGDHRAWYRLLAVGLIVGLVAASTPTEAAQCAAQKAAAPAQVALAPPPSPSLTPTPPPAPPVPTSGCPYPTSGFWCAQQQRFAAAEKYLASRPGITAVVVRNRATGAVWRNSHTKRPIWTASAIKLAMALDLLERDAAGAIRLTPADHAQVSAMIRTSDDNAATRLWERYNGPAQRQRYAAYGLTGLRFPGRVYWGAAQSTAEDFDRLINHVLDLPQADIREYLVKQMQAVGVNQQWGVWGAGAAAAPGNKNGWWGYGSGWVINSVGFVGPDQRYTVTLMNDLQGRGGYKDGVETTTQVAHLLFAERF